MKANIDGITPMALRFSQPIPEASMAVWKKVNFATHSALVEELGAMLVGYSHIALAELIKNSYDADATKCSINVNIEDNSIVVEDNGHGMSKESFLKNWMVIGTRNKVQNSESSAYRRVVTGSKGVGRLSSQFLASYMEIITATEGNPDEEMRIRINWDDYKEKKYEKLEEITVDYRIQKRETEFTGGSKNGMKIILKKLKNPWEKNDFNALAREVWTLQPPQLVKKNRSIEQYLNRSDFEINLRADTLNSEEFSEKLTSALNNYESIIVGEIKKIKDKCVVAINFEVQGQSFFEEFMVSPFFTEVKWEIRIYKFFGKQKEGIKVDDARKYLKEFGGVNIYDSGFRLPYYGRKQDWLDIEFDHSSRMSISSILPAEIRGGNNKYMNDLPTQSRIFGMVHISTNLEREFAPKEQKDKNNYLQIQITRDRLIHNASYSELKRAIRWSLDYYAMKNYEIRQELLSHDNEELRKKKYDALKSEFKAMIAHLPIDSKENFADIIEKFNSMIKEEKRVRQRELSFLTPLASAGMLALIIQHEVKREMMAINNIVNDFNEILSESEEKKSSLKNIYDDLASWVKNQEKTRSLFSSYISSEDREIRKPQLVKNVVLTAVDSIRPLTPGVEYVLEKNSNEIWLPPSVYTDWYSLFTNIFTNSYNAMLDAGRKAINVSYERKNNSAVIKISDTGIGIDLLMSEKYFEPFARETKISDERKNLGLGGQGLGLTIVKMIADKYNLIIKFIKPTVNYNTTLQISWKI